MALRIAVYDILNHLTGDSLFTHQLPRAAGECRPWLVRWFPELGSDAVTDAVAETDAACKATDDPEQKRHLCASLVRNLIEGGAVKAEYELDQIPADDHIRKDPYDELVEMRGTDEGQK